MNNSNVPPVNGQSNFGFSNPELSASVNSAFSSNANQVPNPYEASVPNHFGTANGQIPPYAQAPNGNMPPVMPPYGASEYSPKSKIVAGLLGIFLGAFGIHNFYLGYTGKGIAQLLITVFSLGILSFISGIWGLIEGILILVSTRGKFWHRDARGIELYD